MKEIYSYKDFTISSPLLFKDIEGRKGIVTGYFAEFNSLDADGDVIKPGAFSRSINATGPQSAKPRIKHLMNHDVSQPLGVLMVLKEDEKGLYYESKLGNHALGMDFIKMAESGLITEHSIGYQTKKFNQITSWEDYKEGDIRRELTELKLWEGSSLTAWGANANTPLTGLKSQVELNKLINKAEAIEKFCRDTKATDETIEMLLLYNKQLLQSITDLKSTQTETTIDPDEVECPNCHKQTKNVEAGMGYLKCSHCESTFDNNGKLLTVGKADPVKTTLPDVVECPSCNRFTYNTQEEKGYIKCHRCSAQFVYGSKLFIKL